MSEPRTVHLYLTDSMADWEPGHALAHITKRDYQRSPGRYVVRTVASADSPVTTMAGLRVLPDATLDEVTPEATALLMLPGATTWEQPGLHDDILAKAHTLVDAGTPVAAICGATFGMAAAGLLDDRDHTSNAAEYLAMSGYAGGRRYRDQKVVTDRGIITAGAMHPVDFAAAVFAALDLYEPEVLAAWHGLFTSGDPAHYATLAAA